MAHGNNGFKKKWGQKMALYKTVERLFYDKEAIQPERNNSGTPVSNE
jgi:hypothetical protein